MGINSYYICIKTIVPFLDRCNFNKKFGGNAPHILKSILDGDKWSGPVSGCVTREKNLLVPIKMSNVKVNTEFPAVNLSQPSSHNLRRVLL
jgi:hypothetical protein